MDTKKIDAEIALLVKESESVTETGLKVTTKRLKIIKRRVGYLRGCIRYIQTNPREGFVTEEIERILRGVGVLEDRQAEWMKNHPNTTIAKYRSESGITKLKKSLALLRFISK